MKTTVSKQISILFLILGMICFGITSAYAQEEEPEKKKESKPIRPAWTASALVETQTDLVWDPKTLEFVMQHRFGLLNANNGFDLAGIYGASNIRIGLVYGLFKNFNIGVGTQKNNLIQDVNWKYKILTQTRDNKMPVSLAYFGNVQFDCRDKSFFGAEYKFTNRMAYFHQLIVSRKFSRSLSIQATANFAHYNQLNQDVYPNLEHSNFGFGVGGRLKISGAMYLIFEYDQALTTPGALKWLKETDPALAQDEVGLRNISLGIEIATSSHAFQLFVTTYNGISYQQNLMFNTNYYSEGAVLIGFNITRNWNF